MKSPNNKLKISILSCFFILIVCQLNAQQITTDSSLSVQDLIENNLADGCVEISNVSSSVNGSVINLDSFGLFNRAGSNFPFERGIVLTTGNVNEAGNGIISERLNAGTSAWGEDPDLNIALGNSETYLNTTSIEFDFISGTEDVQFNYILASEEYFLNNPCIYSDGFAFLIKETGTTNPFVNIALVPGTAIPVNIMTVHDEVDESDGCPASNDEFFEGFNLGDTNYNGKTTVLTAATTVTANVSYTIKLIIADARDQFFDSAVFIEANSFDNSVDLGPDISTCDANVTLDGTVSSTNATYSWFFNNATPPISSSPILNVNQSGFYTVEVSLPLNGNTCVFTDIIEVQVNNIETGPELTAITLCDDPSNDGDENFDFSSAETEVLALLPQPETYTITYHNNPTDASNGISEITNTTAYTNTSLREEIFIRAVNSAGCVYLSSFNIILNEFPIITDPTDQFIICADDGGANLNTLNDGITGMNPNYTVTYHTSPADAQTGDNALVMPYSPTTDPETVFIRVTTNAGCFDIADVEVKVNDNPTLEEEIQQIDACEQDDDGFEVFDITSVQDEIIANTTGFTVTYHENETDALTGDNPITNPTAYTNIIEEEQNVYIRVVDDLTGCATIRPIELHVQLLYTGTDFIITPNDPVEYIGCDNDLDGSVEFDLTEISGLILNNVDDTIVQYFENDPATNPSEPALDQNIPFIVGNTNVTLFVILNRTGPDCEYSNQITLIKAPGVAINPLTEQDYCDSDADLSFATIDFTFFSTYLSSQVTSSGSFSFAFYPTQLNAEENTDRYATIQDFTPATNPFSVFVRISNEVTGCFTIEELPINLLPAPSISTPTTPLTVCNSNDTINLNAIIPQINSGSNLTFSFFETEADANANIGAITNPTAYNSTSRTLFTRIENNNNCYDIQAFEVVFNDKPQVTIADYVICLPFNSTSNTVEFLYENDIDPIIMDASLPNSDTNITSPVTTSYFENYNSSTGVLSNPIDKTQPDPRTSPTDQEIYVLVEYVNDPSCFTVIPFTIKIGVNPEYNTAFRNFQVCDDASNDGQAIFNLTEFTTVLQQGSSQSLTITYYLNEDDAFNQQNAIPNPETYQNPAGQNPQTLYFNVDNGTICNGIDNFEILVNPIPTVGAQSIQTVCDDDLDGISTFNFESITNDIILNAGVRQNVVVNYFQDIDAFNSGTQIPSSQTTNYTNFSNPQTVVIQVLNTDTNCFDTVELELNVEVPPTLTSPIIQICDNAANIYDLNEATPQLIGAQTNVEIAYYESESDAETETDALNLNFNYTSNSTTLYARANFVGSTCFYIESFRLNIINPPTLSQPADLVSCDDSDFDLIEPFDLNGQAEIALGTQNPADFIISYHNTLEDANDNVTPLTNLNVVTTNNTYFIRVESRASGCVSITSINTIVNRKPELELNDATLCLDNLAFIADAETGVTTDRYLWSTGETTPSIEINTIGRYSVTITTAELCTNTDSFDLVESEAATIEFTETVDFSSPNNSITIDVSGIGDYLFQLDGNAPQESNIFQDVSYGVHIVTVIDQLGCNSVSKEVIVFDIPPFFTPNSDGFNDNWHVIGVEELEGTIVYIFDRYGKLLKTLTHTSQGWNGTYNGNAMPTNDYWYVANIKQGEKEFELKGHFTLKR